MTSSHGTDTDPETYILVNRVAMLRRMIGKQPWLEKIAARVLAEYKSNHYVGTIVENVHSRTTLAAPHPGKGGRKHWKPYYYPFRPIGILLCNLHEKAAACDASFNIHTHSWPALPILTCPVLELKPAVRRIAADARTSANANVRKISTHLHTIDHLATTATYVHLPPDHAGVLRMIQQGATWDASLVAKAQGQEQVLCEHCGASNVTFRHTIWDCPSLQEARDAALSQHIPGIDTNQVHPSVLFGIAPAMNCNHNRTLWGSDAFHLDAHHKDTFGARRTIITSNDNDEQTHFVTLDETSISTLENIESRIEWNAADTAEHGP